MKCRICKKRDATIKIFDEPLCDKCHSIFKAAVVSLVIGLVEDAFSEVEEEIRAGAQPEGSSTALQEG